MVMVDIMFLVVVLELRLKMRVEDENYEKEAEEVTEDLIEVEETSEEDI